MEANSVSIATDLTSGWSAHLIYGYPGPPDVYEQSAPMNWSPGKGMLRHSLAPTVFVDSQSLVLDQHDLGPLLPHQPVNNPIHSLKSSRKVVYVASSVVACGKAVACVDASTGTDMLVCGDPMTVAGGGNDSNATRTVFVGMSEMDRLKGDVAVRVAQVTDLCSFVLAVATFSPATAVGEVAVGFGLDLLGIDPNKAGIGAIVGFGGSVAVSYASGWKEPIVYKVEAGGSAVGLSFEHTYRPDQGTITSKESVTVAGVKVEAETDYSKVTGRYENAWTGKKGEKSWGPAL